MRTLSLPGRELAFNTMEAEWQREVAEALQGGEYRLANVEKVEINREACLSRCQPLPATPIPGNAERVADPK